MNQCKKLYTATTPSIPVAANSAQRDDRDGARIVASSKVPPTAGEPSIRRTEKNSTYIVTAPGFGSRVVKPTTAVAKTPVAAIAKATTESAVQNQRQGAEAKRQASGKKRRAAKCGDEEEKVAPRVHSGRRVGIRALGVQPWRT